MLNAKLNIRCRIITLLFCIVTAAFATQSAPAQSAGNVVDGSQSNQRVANASALPEMSAERATHFITIDGVAEIRVVPTEIRMVMAMVSEAETANECQEKSLMLVQAIKDDWLKTGIGKDDMFEDFVAILPVYEFQDEQWNNLDVMKETLKRFRYQTNFHVRLTGNEQARKALQVAFSHGVTDIVSFDYWSSDLETVKTLATKKAIDIASKKSDVLLATELFRERPPLINIQSETQTVFPAEMYASYTNTIEQTVTLPYNFRDNIPRVNAPRPVTTYYRGPVISGDSLSNQLPMKPEISVVASVRLYYESPAKDKVSAADDH